MHTLLAFMDLHLIRDQDVPIGVENPPVINNGDVSPTGGFVFSLSHSKTRISSHIQEYAVQCG